MSTYRCTIRESHKCDKNYRSEYKLTRHVAAYRAAQKRKAGKGRKEVSKKVTTSGYYQCGWILRSSRRRCGKNIRKVDRKKHENRHRGAEIASTKNFESEKEYAEKLRGENHNSVVFHTGKETGVPDIVMYKNGKMSFYEIKPTGKGDDSLLKASQAKWIIKNCLGKKIDVYLVRYKGTNKFIFTKIKLNKNNIGRYAEKSERIVSFVRQKGRNRKIGYLKHVVIRQT